MHQIIKTLIISLFFFSLMNTSLFSANTNLPENTIIYEAEDYHIKNFGFKQKDFIHASGGSFIAGTPAEYKTSHEIEIFKASFPKNNDDYTIWAFSKGLDLGISGPLMEIRKLKTASAVWEWHNLGKFNSKTTGNTFSIMAVPDKANKSPENGLDSVILSKNSDFKPNGIYSGYSPEAENETGKKLTAAETQTKSIPSAEIKVFPEKKKFKISKYLASANAHSAARHIIGTPEWDNTMKTFFSGNILCLVENARKKPDQDGIWWNFKEIDEFILKAKEGWGAEELLFLPAWQMSSVADKQQDYTAEELEKGKAVLMQLIERYGKPGPLYVRYWVLSDEWPGLAYWKENYKKFAEYYSYLFREVKKINPDIKIGGPVDCWPNDKIIAELLQQTPKLDFIAWNMFSTGRADTPLERLFQNAKNYKLSISSSRQLSEKILKKEIPVIVTSFAPNYHAWDPKDYRLAQPVTAAWTALVFSYMAESKCFSGLYYTTRATDAGLFGPADPFAITSKMIPADIDKNIINIRPAARALYFFIKNINGRDFNETLVTGDSDKINAITASAGNEIAIVIVNYSNQTKRVTLTINPYERTAYSGFELPDEYFYSDEYKVMNGTGLFFSSEGTADLLMPPYSTWCINTKYKKASKDQVK